MNEKLNELKLKELKLKTELSTIQKEIKKLEDELNTEELNKLIVEINNNFKKENQPFELIVNYEKVYSTIYLNDLKRQIKYQVRSNLDNATENLKAVKQLQDCMPLILQFSAFLKSKINIDESTPSFFNPIFSFNKKNNLIPNYKVMLDMDMFDLNDDEFAEFAEFAFEFSVFDIQLSMQELIQLNHKLNEFIKNELQDEIDTIMVSNIDYPRKRLSVYYDTSSEIAIQNLRNQNGLTKLIQKMIKEINFIINKRSQLNGNKSNS